MRRARRLQGAGTQPARHAADHELDGRPGLEVPTRDGRVGVRGPEADEPVADPRGVAADAALGFSARVVPARGDEVGAVPQLPAPAGEAPAAGVERMERVLELKTLDGRHDPSLAPPPRTHRGEITQVLPGDYGRAVQSSAATAEQARLAAERPTATRRRGREIRGGQRALTAFAFGWPISSKSCARLADFKKLLLPPRRRADDVDEYTRAIRNWLIARDGKPARRRLVAMPTGRARCSHSRRRTLVGSPARSDPSPLASRHGWSNWLCVPQLWRVA